MILSVVLDTGPLGILSNPRDTPDTLRARAWLVDLQAAGRHVILPEIADYEARRDLIRGNKWVGIARLDLLGRELEYLALTTPAMRLAAEFWALARSSGRPTAADPALDGDVILAAQAALVADRGSLVVVATTNVSHLGQYVHARHWLDIS